MKIGYARVSTYGQNLDTQIEILKNEGCQRIFQEKISGTILKRPELEELFKILREDDTVIVSSLTRISRKRNDTFEIIERIGKAKAKFKALDFPMIDTTTPMGELLLTIVAAISQYFASDNKLRAKNGQRLAKEKGTHIGRKKGVNQDDFAKVQSLVNKDYSNKDIVNLTGISLSSIKRYKRMMG